MPLLGMGKALGSAGRATKAIDIYHRTISILESNLRVESKELVVPLTTLGNLLLNEGKAEDAENAFTRIVGIYTQLYGKDDERVGMAMCSLANAKCAKEFDLPQSRLKSVLYKGRLYLHILKVPTGSLDRMFWLGVSPEPLKRNQLLPDEDDAVCIKEAANALTIAIDSALSSQIRANAYKIAQRLSTGHIFLFSLSVVTYARKLYVVQSYIFAPQ